MSVWASIILALLNLSVSLTEYLSNQKLIKSGEDAALLEALEKANARIQTAIDARRAVSASVPGNDPYCRD